MAPASPLPPAPRRILELARRDRAAARAVLAELPLEAQVDLVCQAPPERRAALIDLAEAPEALIPALPEAELCFAVKAAGLADAAALLEHATDEQLATCVDLDAWTGDAPDPVALAGWLDVLAEAGEERLLRAARSLDMELLVIALRPRIRVVMKPRDDEGWQPPAGFQTLEGQFWFAARRTGDDLASPLALLHALFREDYWVYFRLCQALMWELESETELYARRWREGRLQDLGFPPRGEALPIYARLDPARMTAVPVEARALEIGRWHLPVRVPDLPLTADTGRPLLRAAAELDERERESFLYALLGLANRVAVADRLPLGDADSVPVALDKAIRLAGEGLAYLVRATGSGPLELLRRLPLARLFQVGANASGEIPPPAALEGEETEAGALADADPAA